MISFIIIMSYLNWRLMAARVRGCVHTQLKLRSARPDSVGRERATERTDDESGHHDLARLSGAKGQGRRREPATISYRLSSKPCPRGDFRVTDAYNSNNNYYFISPPQRATKVKTNFFHQQIVYKYPCGTQPINSIVDRQSVLGTSYYGRAITI